jgi:hypothetical protein
MPIQIDAKYSLLEGPSSPFWSARTSFSQPLPQPHLRSAPLLTTSLPMAKVLPFLSAANPAAAPSGPAVASLELAAPDPLHRIFVPRVCNGFGLYD